MKKQVAARLLVSQEVQLICNCCGQPYYPDKAREDQGRAILFGAEEYAICPLCTQQVPEHVFDDSAYRLRCHYEVARLKRLSEESKAKPRTRALTFKVSQKGAASVYGLGRFPVTLYYGQWIRLLDATQKLRDFMEANITQLTTKQPHG